MMLSETQIKELTRDTILDLLTVLYRVEDELDYPKEISNTINCLQNELEKGVE